ncbi:MAG: tetratricopeptide repeat protein [Alphaproteobacteria bacterium]
MTASEEQNTKPLVGSLSAVLADALRAYDQNDLPRVEEILRQVLEAVPNADIAWHLRGLTAQKRGDLDNASRYLGEAQRQAPANPIFNRDLGAVLLANGSANEALRHLRMAAELDQTDPATQFQMANAQAHIGDFTGAIENYRHCISKQPESHEAFNNLSFALRRDSQVPSAIAAARKSLALFPDFTDALNNLGLALCDARQYPEAIENFRAAIEISPDNSEIVNNLGVAIHANGDLAEAAHIFRRVIAIRPDWPEALVNLGNVLRSQGNFEAAAALYRTAHSADPDSTNALGNLGLALLNLNNPVEAAAVYTKVLSISPNNGDIRTSLGIAQLMQGNYAEGWQNYEARWHAEQFTAKHRRFAIDRWKGEPLQGRKLLVYAEQGFGDTLQFCRYLTLLSDQGADVHFECQRPMVELCRSLRGIKNVIARKDTLPEADYCIPLMSIPQIFNTTLESVPANVPYLSPSSPKVDSFRAQLGDTDLKVGLVWLGNPDRQDDGMRSCPETALAQIRAVNQVQFVSLQVGQISPNSLGDLLDFGTQCASFDDTAAAVEALDLVITVDTATAHLAGALGKPVWVMLGHHADWRYLMDREDSPWYPTMRLFRQSSHGDWEGLAATVARELAQYARHSNAPTT